MPARHVALASARSLPRLLTLVRAIDRPDMRYRGGDLEGTQLRDLSLLPQVAQHRARPAPSLRRPPLAALSL